MAGDTFAACAACLMMGVLLDGRRMWPAGRFWAVAIQTQDIGRLAQVSGMLGAMHIVAGETSNAMRVHLAGNVIISLHAIFVRGTVAKMREGSLAQLVLF